MMPDGYAACTDTNYVLVCVTVLIECPHDHLFSVNLDRVRLDSLSDLALECLQAAQIPADKVRLGTFE